MQIFKCKMCGGTVEFADGEKIGVCDSCGSRQTIPKSKDENISNLFSRANILRLKCDFDKAEQIYEKIIGIDDTEAEAYWGIVLCKYGVEYVDDPATGKKIPTCHRTLFEAITTNSDYQAALRYADPSQIETYEFEAKNIDFVQKNIFSTVNNEEPYDVFICYKETDDSGKRTRDSAIANDIYYQLKQEGFKVFYAAITLEDKLGHEYEPYIFAALNSSKVMLVLGTEPSFFNAVWVKNEWSRFLKIMKEDHSKLLIPCYRDMDPYELPEEFAHFQAQDMGKIGFLNDIVRGIKKVIEKKEETKTEEAHETTAKTTQNDASSLLRRAEIFLGDKEFDKADEYCERVLDIEPECAEAYFCKFLAESKLTDADEIYQRTHPVVLTPNFTKAEKYSDELLFDKIRKFKTQNRNLAEAINNRKREEIEFQQRQEIEKTEAVKRQFLNKAYITNIVCAVIVSLFLIAVVLIPAVNGKVGNPYSSSAFSLIILIVYNYILHPFGRGFIKGLLFVLLNLITLSIPLLIIAIIQIIKIEKYKRGKAEYPYK